MRQFIGKLFLLLLFTIGVFLSGSITVVSANSICNGPPFSSACVIRDCSYLQDNYCDGPAPYFTRYVCGRVWVPKTCCTIPQAGGGSCVCCTSAGGCYLDCPGTTPVAGGGVGGVGGNTPTPIPPTPTPAPNTGNLWVKAVYVDSAATTCADALAAVVDLNGATFSFTPAVVPASQTQSFDYVKWNNVAIGAYTLTASPPARNYISANTCVNRSSWPVDDYRPQSAVTVVDGETAIFYKAYTTPAPTPLPAGTVQARAVIVPVGTVSCGAVQASTNYAPVNVEVLTDATIKQTTSSYAGATWTNSPIGTKSILENPVSPDLVLAIACWDGVSGGSSATLANGATLTLDLGYTAGVGWWQSQGGDVYAAGTLRSYVPSAAAAGSYVNLDGAGGTPSVVTYGSTYDFDNDITNTGDTLVSSKNCVCF